MQDIHPIRSPIAIGFDPALMSILVWVTAGGVLALILFVVIRKWLKNKNRVDQAANLPLPLPPCESAMQALDRLELGPKGDIRGLYFSLTLILRQYIGRTFTSHAAEMTSQEFLRHLNGLDMEKTQKAQIIDFQHFSDPIKYAGMVPAGHQAQSDLSMVRNVIQKIENTQVEKNQKQTDPIPGNTNPVTQKLDHKTLNDEKQVDLKSHIQNNREAD